MTTNMNRIDCNLARGTGDARVALAVVDGDLALETNGGMMRVDATGAMAAPECSLAAASEALRVSPAELRAAVVAAYPAADGWDWAGGTLRAYAVRWADGATERHVTYADAVAVIRARHPDAAVGHSGDLRDGGTRTLAWASDADAEGDDGARAVAQIEVSS